MIYRSPTSRFGTKQNKGVSVLKAGDSITVIGRRWFRKSAGNTYTTAEIYVNGDCVHKTPMQGGYGDHYLTIAGDWLDANGYTARKKHANGSCQPLWQYCRDEHGIGFVYSVSDVPRERDL